VNILGIDIGYSNLKLAFGPKGESAKTHLRPAGAAPADRFGSRFDGKAQDEFLHVLSSMGRSSWPACRLIERRCGPVRFMPTTPPARPTALFHAGLLLSEMDRIEVLVTGLPVSQYLDEARRMRWPSKCAAPTRSHRNVRFP
jgi:plasmid segregation protein ParM